jgi:hypothetical protein
MEVQGSMAVLGAVRWVRLPVGDRRIDRRAPSGPGALRATEWLCAERSGRPPLALAAMRPQDRQAWTLGEAVGALAEEAMPLMRPVSIGIALALAAGSLLWAPLAAAAMSYGLWRATRRALLRHRLRTEIDGALHHAIVLGDAGDYRSVRSFQISGNSTTSSILRR